jgi:hypothetical protein
VKSTPQELSDSTNPRKRDEFCVSLRIFGADLDPSEITRLLGCEPTYAARTGDIVSGHNGRSRTVRQGNWRLCTESSDLGIEEQLVALLARVTSDVALWQALTARFDVDVFCGVFPAAEQHGFELSPRLHRLLADRNLSIGFDIYAQSSATEAA